jgi:hypothetical protein
METKQTALEWLEKQLVINGSGAIKTFPELFEQAKQMEKEHIINTFKHAQVLVVMNNELRAEQYYNETYNQ